MIYILLYSVWKCTHIAVFVRETYPLLARMDCALSASTELPASCHATKYVYNDLTFRISASMGSLSRFFFTYNQGQALGTERLVSSLLTAAT